LDKLFNFRIKSIRKSRLEKTCSKKMDNIMQLPKEKKRAKKAAK